MNCAQCGTEINLNTKFCSNCGKVVEVDQDLKPVNTGNSQGCGIVILVLICVSVLVSMCNSGDRERYKKNQEIFQMKLRLFRLLVIPEYQVKSEGCDNFP